MKWIEVIHIRPYLDPASEQIRSAFHELEQNTMPAFLTGIQLFRNLTVDCDLAIYLYWSNDAPPEGISALGMKLASSFSEFGWINHTGWVLDKAA